MRSPTADQPERIAPVLVLAGLGAFVTGLDATIVGAAVPSIGRDLGIGLSELSLVGVGYLVPFALLLPFAGSLVDRLDRTRALVGAFTADAGVIVVMPTDGPAGSYTRWRNHGRSGGIDWETFHTVEVRQLVDRNYRGGPQRAVAGISIGGYGALAYACRRRGVFAAAASYSGVPDTLSPGAPTLIKGNVLRYGLDVYAMWGDDVLDREIWVEQNPADHVRALLGTTLYVSAGNGKRGPFDGPLTLDLLEGPALTSARSFLAAAAEAGVPVTADLYGAGTHSWPYWERALHRSWPVLAEAMGLEVRRRCPGTPARPTA